MDSRGCLLRIRQIDPSRREHQPAQGIAAGNVGRRIALAHGNRSAYTAEWRDATGEHPSGSRQLVDHGGGEDDDVAWLSGKRHFPDRTRSTERAADTDTILCG